MHLKRPFSSNFISINTVFFFFRTDSVDKYHEYRGFFNNYIEIIKQIFKIDPYKFLENIIDLFIYIYICIYTCIYMYIYVYIKRV